MELKNIELREITDREDYLEYIPWLKEISFTDMTYLDCLSRCLSGQYRGIAGYVDGVVIGILIYYFFQGDKCFVVALHGKNNTRQFIDMFFDMLKDEGIKKVRGSTSRDEVDAYGRLMRMDKLWTVFERVL